MTLRLQSDLSDEEELTAREVLLVNFNTALLKHGLQRVVLSRT